MEGPVSSSEVNTVDEGFIYDHYAHSLVPGSVFQLLFAQLAFTEHIIVMEKVLRLPEKKRMRVRERITGRLTYARTSHW